MSRRMRLVPSDNGLKALARVISAGLQGKRLSRARCSIGSVLLLDFGELQTVGEGKREREIGEWHLFVEMATWVISQHGKMFLTSDDESSKIKSTIAQLEGGAVRETLINRKGNVRLKLENGFTINLFKENKVRYHHNWTFFYKEAVRLSNEDTTNSFEFMWKKERRPTLQHPPGFDGLEDVSEWKSLPPDEARKRYHFLSIAHQYITKFWFAKRCLGYWTGLIVPDFLGAFLYEFEPIEPDIPRYCWVVAGSLWPYPLDETEDQFSARKANYEGVPNAYIWAGIPPDPEYPDLGPAPNPLAALRSYCSEIRDWVQAVRDSENLDDVFPVEFLPIARTEMEYADIVSNHLKRIEEEILPGYEGL